MPTPRSLMEQAERILRDVFGFSSFRAGQQDIVQAVLGGQDVVGVLPTGGGKSLCYQVPALVFPNLTLVVSPLIALMQDQTERLRQRGVGAYALHSGLTQGEVNDIIYRASRGEIKLLYVAPERLESQTFRRQLQSIPMSLLAVDEAHCISEWGHDFRPSYRSILALFETRERVPIIAVTATATPDVRTDIATSLKLRRPIEIVRGFARPNLSFVVEQTAAKVEYVTRAARKLQNGSMIVYCASRRRVETMVDELCKRGIHAAGYHGGMPHHQRTATQEAFLRDALQVLVATNAFGMGVDKPNVRHVVHTDLTLTLEAYYQEAGRAGRDGDPSTCTLLYQPEDQRLMKFYIETTYPDKHEIAAVYDYLCTRAGLSMGQRSQTPIMADNASIASALHTTEASVRGITSLLERNGLIVLTSPHGSARITLRTTIERFTQFTNQAPPEYRAACQLLSRYIGTRGIGEEIDLPVVEILRRSDVTSSELSRALGAMQLAALIRYQAPNSGGGILILNERVTGTALPLDHAALQQRRDRALQKLNVMVGYAESRQCKRNVILAYFGDSSHEGTCGTCSSCTVATQRRAPISDRMLQNINALITATWQVRGKFGRHVIVDIVRGITSVKVQEYRLDRSIAYGSLRERSKPELLEAIDVALDAGLLVKSADLYPTIGVTEKGVDHAGPLPKPLLMQRSNNFQQERNQGIYDRVLGRLFAMRERIAALQGVLEQSLCTNAELAALAEDRPTSLTQFVPGRHGSAMFLTQYAGEIFGCMQDEDQRDTSATGPVDVDVERMLRVVSDRTTFEGLAQEMKMTKPALAALLQRAIESGQPLERGCLIDEPLFARVIDYMRYHRYAKLRDVREHLGGEPSLPELRVALAFARRALYSEIETT